MILEKFGIGIDIVEVNRFGNKPYYENKVFYEKIFLKSELEYCLRFKDPEKHFAGKFAVKEALKKSISKDLSLLDIETLHSNKKPFVKIHKKINYNFLVSISHEKEFAIGVVISELE